MTRIPEESIRKRTFGLTLNPELVEEMRSELKIDNLSGWVNEQMRKAILDNKIIFECACGVTAGISAWEKWLFVCPTCKLDHAKLDRRKRIKLEG